MRVRPESNGSILLIILHMQLIHSFSGCTKQYQHDEELNPPSAEILQTQENALIQTHCNKCHIKVFSLKDCMRTFSTGSETKDEIFPL